MLFLFWFVYSIIFLWGKEIVFKLYQLYHIEAVVCQELVSTWQICFILLYLLNVWLPLCTGWTTKVETLRNLNLLVKFIDSCTGPLIFFIYFYKTVCKAETQRNWVFATNSYFQIPVSLQPFDLNLWYFKLRLFDLTEFIIWNIYGLRHWVFRDIGIWKVEFVVKTQFL